ncbi:hypothetical protein ABEH63_15435, partial [Pseudomonas syringae]
SAINGLKGGLERWQDFQGVPASQVSSALRAADTWAGFYTLWAEYDHKGYAKNANSYQRAQPLTTEKTPQWMGSGFFKPYTPLERQAQ